MYTVLYNAMQSEEVSNVGHVDLRGTRRELTKISDGGEKRSWS